MSSPKQKHFYYVDPGIGEKSRHCPYSFYKDGSDIRSFIRPPDGYELTDFLFMPYEEDSFYDGKIVAQYRKKTLFPAIKKNTLFLLSSLGIVGICVILAHHFLNSRHEPATVVSNTQPPNTEPSVLPIDTTVQTQDSDSSAIAEAIVEESKKEDIVETEKKPKKEGMSIEDQFRQEFWSLIHKRDAKMDSYHNLFVNNKGKVKCEEYEYLRLVILDSTKAYKEWYRKLKTLTDSQLQNINTIAALHDALNNNM